MRPVFRSSRARRRDVRVNGAVYSNVGFETLAEHIGRPRGDALRRLSRCRCLAAARSARRATRLACRRSARLARRSADPRPRVAAAHARRAGDARGGDNGAVPRSRRSAAGLRPVRSERLGPRLRAPRRQVAALDRRRATRRARSVTSVAAAPSSGSIRKPASRSASSRTSTSATGRRKPGRVCRTPCCSRNTRVPVSYPCLAPVRPPAHAAGSCLT